MAYRADIEIAVRGAAQITNLQKQLQSAASGVDLLNSRLRSGAVPSINNFNAVVTQSDRVLRAAAQGTRVQKDAIDVYVRSVAAAEKAEKSLQNAIQKRRQELNISAPTKTGASGGAGKGISGRIGGAISGAAIGGAFPLLFGQGGGAATGGAIGGLAGGLLGPGGSFAGSLVGTLIGDIVSRGQKVKELGQDIGFSAEQTNKLQQAFKLAGQDADKFTEAVQNIRGVGLAVEDQAKAIDLVSKLTKDFGGNVVKTTNAITGALESGKVTQATLNQLTSQGIPIQDALAKKYNTNRDNLLKMAKDGKISVQDLIDTLVDVGNKGTNSTTQTASGFDKLSKSVQGLGSAISSLAGSIVTVMTPIFQWLSARIAELINIATQAISEVAQLINTVAQGPQRAKVISQVRSGQMPSALEAGKLNEILGKGNEQAGYERLQKIIAGTKKGFLGSVDQTAIVTELQKLPEFQAGAPPKLKTFKAPSQAVPSGGGAAKKGTDDTAKKAAELALFVKNTQAATEYLQIQETINQKIFEAEQKRDPLLVARLQGEEKLAAIQYDYAQQLATATTEIERQVITDKGLVTLKNAVAEAARNQQKIEAEISKNTADTLASLDLELALKQATTEEERQRLQIAYDMARLKGQMPDSDIAKIKGKREQLAAPESAGQIASKRMGALSDELRELTNLGNIAVKVADGIGTAFGQAFQGLIDGSMTAREALGSFFKSVGDMFISMATEIIAKQMVMIVLGLIMKALSLGKMGGGNYFDPKTGLGVAGPNFGLAKGGVFDQGGMTAFANGGIVGSPTLFKFADGGATRTGLMGEAGPEAIMPLSRDGSGRLGVNASGLRDAMAGGNSGGGGGTTLNMSFETTSIGGVEYVSRDQLEAAMAQTRKDATRDGAKKGMSMTIDRLQQSPQTRSRVGMR